MFNLHIFYLELWIHIWARNSCEVIFDGVLLLWPSGAWWKVQQKPRNLYVVVLPHTDMPKRGKCEAFHAGEVEEKTRGVLNGFINGENVTIVTASGPYGQACAPLGKKNTWRNRLNLYVFWKRKGNVITCNEFGELDTFTDYECFAHMINDLSNVMYTMVKDM